MCFMVEAERNLEKLSKIAKAQVSKDEFHHFLKNSKENSFKGPDDLNRTCPNTFAAVISMENEQRVISPMRYRVRPAGSSQEVPSKYNVFNARLDSLEKRATWRPLFGKKHGVIALKRFYEWVERDGRKELVSFSAKDHEYIWAPCLFDEYRGEHSFKSFAIITRDPNPEILREGHDRSPIDLEMGQLDSWLSTGKDLEEYYGVLSNHAERYYEVQDEVLRERKEDPQLKLF